MDRKALERLESKIDAIASDVGSIKISVAVNTTNLQEHMRRTEVLEKKTSVGYVFGLVVLIITIYKAFNGIH